MQAAKQKFKKVVDAIVLRCKVSSVTSALFRLVIKLLIHCMTARSREIMKKSRPRPVITKEHSRKFWNVLQASIKTDGWSTRQFSQTQNVNFIV